MRVLVAGSLKDVPRESEVCREFAAALGGQIVQRGHVLLNGCRGSLDQQIASAANECLVKNGKDPYVSIIGYCNKSGTPDHNFGTIRRSSLLDWNMNHPELRIPEQIELADATIFISGREGTFWAKNWAFYARKPILGIPRFGGAGETIYDQELQRLQMKSPSTAQDYESLNQVSKSVQDYAQDVISLAERMVSPRSVFTVMSFDKAYRDVFASFQSVCKEFDFEAERTDHSVSLERIVARVEKGIKDCAFVIADVSEPSPNVFFEVGFARGVGKDLILTSKKPLKPPFDMADLPILDWEDQEELKEKLRKYINGIKGKYGRLSTP
jgi:hypothetical protein